MKLRLFTLCLLGAMALCAHAHELQANRASLVLRDSQHLSVTFYLDYVGVLHQALAPQRSLQDFVLTYSAMPPPAFNAQLWATQTKLQSNTSLTLHNNKTAALSQWVWPKAQAVHSLLQQRAMQAVVAPNAHEHPVQMEIRAELASGNSEDLRSVRLLLPPEFQQVLVVTYQPKQVWVKAGKISPAIRF